jgi:methyl-accepting chemotaxis protein
LGESPKEEPEVAESEEQVEEPGFLDMLAEAEEAVQLLAQAMEEITVVFEGLPVYTDEAMREMAESDARGGGAGGRLRVAQELAGRLEEPATTLEQLAADFVGELTRMAPGISYQIGVIEEDPTILDNDEGARQFADAIQKMDQAAKESLEQVSSLADVVQNMGNISTRLRPVSRRMSSAIRRISGTSHTIEEWGRRLDAVESGDSGLE